MKIVDWLKEKRRPYDIPDCSRKDLPMFFVDMWYKVWAEIGTAKWVFAELICKAWLKLYAIDPWLSYTDYYPWEAGQKSLDEQYDCTIIKKTSMDALNDFEDDSLDFVYIDGNHEFPYVAEDLFHWSKKVRKWGCISWHDYFYAELRPTDNIHTKYIVDSFTKCFHINPWYVIWRKEKIEWESRDFSRSFLWIKK